MEKKNILIFGIGFTGQRLASAALEKGYRVCGTVRSEDSAKSLREKYKSSKDFSVLVFPNGDEKSLLDEVLKADIIVDSCPVNKETQLDPVLEVELLRNTLLARNKKLYVAYLSTTGVYGNTEGAWVDEDSILKATTVRGKGRVTAEKDWWTVAEKNPQVTSTSFRLPGIYGPGRGTMGRLRAGNSRLIIKDNQYFSRIHVDDIVGVLLTAFEAENVRKAYNVCDDYPCDNAEVVRYACELLGIPCPEGQKFEDIKDVMNPMARSFYEQSRRVKNDLIKTDLKYELKYPTYKEGFVAQFEEEKKGSLCSIL